MISSSLVFIVFVRGSLTHWEIQKTVTLGFPGGSVIKNPSASAGGTGSIPGLGRSRMLWDNQCSRACELQLLRPACPGACAPQEKPLQREACTPQLESSLHSSEDPSQP